MDQFTLSVKNKNKGYETLSVLPKAPFVVEWKETQDIYLVSVDASLHDEYHITNLKTGETLIGGEYTKEEVLGYINNNLWTLKKSEIIV